MSDGVISVIGAGIVGVATAIWLQRDGHEVVLIDKVGPAAGASHGNGGVIVPSGIVPINSPGLIKNAPQMLLQPSSPLFLRWAYLPRMLPWLMGYLKRANRVDAKKVAVALRNLLVDSVSQHRELAAGTGAEKWIHDSDYVFVYPDSDAFEKDKFAWNLRREAGIKWETLDHDGLHEYDAAFSGTGDFAIRLPDHARIADPGRYVSDLAEHFVKQGGRMEVANVSGFDLEKSKLKAVTTDQGDIVCSKSVVTSGVWSKAMMQSLGLKIPMESERGYHIDLFKPSAMPRAAMMLAAGKFVITPMAGKIRCAGIVEFGGTKAEASTAPIKLLKSLLAKTCPHLEYERVEQWMGHRPAPVDSIPLIGALSKSPDVYAAFGHHHIGLTAGPKTGRLVADLIGGRRCEIDLQPYSPQRFVGSH